MNSSLVGRVGIACAIFVVIAAVILLAPAPRIAASGSGTLDACVNPGNGNLRLVDSAAACHANESFVEWNITGPQGPQGVQGPPGESAGGPPFTWVCTPAFYPLSSGSPRADLYVFNGSTSTANVSVNILDKGGNNLAGVTIPGSSPPSTYPGQTGTSTVPVSPANTLNLNWFMPDDTSGPETNVSYAVRVVSDQPVVVSSDFQFSGFHALPCSLLPK